MIRAIDARSVDQITSGQVVTSLSSALKELVENSLDAGATVVEINVQNHGRDGFSVQDNGSGIVPEDFENLARRHATSKLSSFSDLAAVRTLGFRGEALASLCALAEVRITTNPGSDSGFELVLDSKGNVTSVTKVARPKGTLVSVTNLFRTVPVRRRDFERNFQREFTKSIALLQEYALLSPVRLTVDHSVKNRHSMTLRSQGANLLQRIACVYGASRTAKLMEINLSPEELGIDCSVTGYISKPVFGMGQATSDRQLIAINGRPSKQLKLVRTIMDVYKQFNLTESPFFVLNFEMDPARYDVNVSPDKRALLLHREAELITALRDALTVALNAAGHSVPRSSLDVPSPKRQKQSKLSFAAFAGSGTVIEQQHGNDHSDDDDAYIEDRTVDSSDEESEEVVEPVNQENQTCEPGPVEPLHPEPLRAEPEPLPAEPSLPESSHLGSSHADSTALNDTFSASKHSVTARSKNLETDSDMEEVTGDDNDSEPDDSSEDEPAPITPAVQEEEEEDEEPGLVTRHETPTSQPASSCQCSEASLGSVLQSSEPVTDFSRTSPSTLPPVVQIKNEILEPPSSPDRSPLSSNHGSPTVESSVSHSPSQKPPNLAQRIRPPAQPRSLNHHIHLPVSLNDIKEARNAVGETPQNIKTLQKLSIEEDGVEERLSLNIHKEDFSEMEIVGQFNLGFILVVHRKKSHEDLFVIDQHASDEIFNFERLQRSTVLSRQPLVTTHTLELSAVEELTIAENLGVFENNGFSIKVTPTNPPGRQCSLLSVPFSKNTVFDEKDVQDLLSKIQEDPENKQVRCSKLRAMLAMRACRSSIMIGKPLSMSTMKKVVRNLGTLDRPWNCPHGRPTLRHITTLS